MKIMVTYYSLTGNTGKVAQAICDEIILQGHICELEELKNVNPENLDPYDVIFIGSACHDSGLANPVKQFLENLTDSAGLNLAGFVTHSTQMPTQGQRQRELYNKWAGFCLPTFENACSNKNIPFLGYFHCQGKPSPGIADFIHSTILTKDIEWNAYIAEVMKHPDKVDVQRAKDFAKRVLAKY